ncbi:MAG: DUF805 domain-containing protein [Thermoguttaceae bacterium]|nr:DUF805 domain-containing protein [Thermoguttaceae bacterium]
MPYCEECGAEVGDARFCSTCGAAVAAFEAENPYAVGSQTQTVGLDYSDDDPNAPEIPGFVGSYAAFWKKYFVMKGRASRREFWSVCLWHILVFLPFWTIIAVVYVDSPFDTINDLLTETDCVVSEIWDVPFDGARIAPVVAASPLSGAQIARVLGARLAIWSYLVAAFVPSLCLLGRRLHDGGAPAWTIVIFIFLRDAAPLFLLVAGLASPTRGTNKYGPQPRKRVKS